MEKQIQINGIEYIRADSVGESKNINRFNFTTSKKLIQAISKRFTLAGNPTSEEYFLKNDKALVDPANVGLIYGKSEESKRLLSFFVDKESGHNEIKDFPDLTYDKSGVSRFSLEYFKPFIDILNITDDSIKIKVQKNYPITIENKDFIIVLAPKVESKDE